MPRPEDLILAPDAESFAVAARPLLEEPDRLDRLVPGLLRETALRHWREDYPKHIPHALLALLGGLEARDLLEGPERIRPVVQALSYVAREKHYPRLQPGSVPARGDADTLAAALPAGDFPAAFGAVRALCGEGRPGEVREILLRDGVGDGFNLFHRFIHAAKVFRRLEAQPELDAEALLCPVVHYACLAPRDPRPLRPADDSPVRLAEAVFAEAVSRMPGADGYDWVPVAHVATFAEAAGAWARDGASPERRAGPAAARDFLDEIAATVPPPSPAPVAEPAPDPEAAAARLASAVADRRPEDAAAAAAALEARPGARPLLLRTLLLACAGIDGALAFSHDVKVAADLVRLAGDGLVDRHPRCPADLAAFLAGLPGDGPWAREISGSR